MKNLFHLVLLLPLGLVAQKNTPPGNDNTLWLQTLSKPDLALYVDHKFDTSNLESSILSYYANLPQLHVKQTSLRLKSASESPMGKHLFFEQLFKNVPVYEGYLKVNVNKEGVQLSGFNHLHDIENPEMQPPPTDSLRGQPLFVMDHAKLIPAYRRIVDGVEVVTDARNDVLIFARDIRRYFQHDDTMIQAMVFRPDPLTTAGVPYGYNGTYKHFKDSDYALINNERQAVTFPGTFRNDSFRLENDWVIMQDLLPPTIPTTVLPTNNFSFTRKLPGFKETMVMYHLYVLKQYLASIGFGSYPSFRLKVDAHSDTGDQSYWNPNDSSLHFGIGGVPDAEDADVITHEYTHAVTQTINTSNITSRERHAIDEALGDVVACNHSYRMNTFKWRWVFNWDGHNTDYWNGRDGGDTTRYNYRDSGNFYLESQVWTSTINDIAEAIGHDTAVKMMLLSVFSYTPFTTMPEAARLVMQVDSAAFGGSYGWKIGPIFNARQLGSFPTGIANIGAGRRFSMYNSAAFAEGTGDASVELDRISDINVYNIQGQRVLAKTGVKGHLSIAPQDLPCGMYIVTIENEQGSATAKLNRF